MVGFPGTTASENTDDEAAAQVAWLVDRYAIGRDLGAAMSVIPTKQLQFHPLAVKYGGNVGKSEDALAKDIADNGQRFPIVVHNGQIIEGIQRYDACPQAKIEPIIMPYHVERYGGEEKDIEAFIVSANIHRRHDTKRKRSAASRSWCRCSPPRLQRSLNNPEFCRIRQNARVVRRGYPHARP
jgi:hypothetical protein